MVDRFWNWPFADAIKDGRARLRLPDGRVDEPMPELVGSTDFFGLNYYFRYFARPAPSQPEMVALTPGPGPQSELGGQGPVGDSPPEALPVLMREAWKRYHQPIYITEGGIADNGGAVRSALIRGQRLAIDRLEQASAHRQPPTDRGAASGGRPNADAAGNATDPS